MKEASMNFRRPIQIGLLAATTLIGSVALAQQGQPQSPTDHGAHHGAGDQQESQRAPGDGMMGGMMGQSGMRGQDGKDGGPDMMGCPMMGKGMMGKGMMHARPMMEAHLAYIKADLEITDAQMEAWDAYAEAVRGRHATMEGMHADMKKAKESGTAVERMDARIKAMEDMVESLKALKPATEGLYAVLTDVQKEKADKLLGGGCGMM
jgi:hypothetical protein